ncbi:tetratricopeptide repeat protein [Streptomyces sp. NPDC057257]|uniref:tetratricopeptide repeat protein n=1 Tax=Streptomyces sp. NPDC057257 TaxID=3346071 RepID=UPI0036453F4C
MSRLSREKKREEKPAAQPAALVAAPIDVRVLADGPRAGDATVGGVPVPAVPGEEIQQTVLNHLHRIALATGHPVRAMIHDERIGYVVPLEVGADGGSSFAGEPVRMPPPPVEPKSVPGLPAGPTGATGSETDPGEPGEAPMPAAVPEDAPRFDKPTQVMRSVAEPVRDSAPTFPLRAVSEPQPLGENVPTFRFRALPAPPQDRAPGTVAPPQGEFGPPPVMDAVPPRPALEAGPTLPPGPDRTAAPEPAATPEPAAAPTPESTLRPQTTTSHPTSSASTSSAPPAPLAFPTEPEPDPKHTPARGFDAVAEAVLGDEPPTGPGFLAEPMGRINEAVKAGRIDEAAGVAERTVGEAMAVLGTEHAEVLRLRELSAYIAYLAGEPVRAFRLSLDLARIHRRTGDAEAAYGNVQSAASAWRAVRDPRQGLDLGRDLIALWTELTTEDGPAAEDVERLDSARTRMDRLTERARKSAQ